MLSRLILLVFLSSLHLQLKGQESVYFTNGMKIQHVTSSSAVIWTRLCADSIAVPISHEQDAAPFRSPIDFDNDMPIEKMDGAVNGIFGEVKIIISDDVGNLETEWKYVSEYRDFTIMEGVEDLKANTIYKVNIQGRKSKAGPISEIQGSFKTAPVAGEPVPVSFTSSTCQYFWDYDDPVRGFKAYDSMLKLKPDFHCQTGDYVYYDKLGPKSYNVALARHKWHAINAWPSLVDFYRNVPSFLQKDDHDILRDDASPKSAPYGELTYHDALEIWYEQVPRSSQPFRSLRWGRDLEIWMVEGREFRSDNKMEDGKDKSIFGIEQREWLASSMKASDASFKILMSPTPVVGPDRAVGKNDNHSNAAYQTEGEWLRSFLSSLANTFVVNGDRHWQYVSQDPQTGLLEFSQGPTSDAHAQGWKQEDLRPEHKFLRVKGGFLHVSVYRKDDLPYITFSHFDVDGNVVHEEIIEADQNRK